MHKMTLVLYIVLVLSVQLYIRYHSASGL